MAGAAGDARQPERADGSRARRLPIELPSPLLALEFLTVLRLRPARTTSAERVAAAQLWYPSVGLLIGLALAGLNRLLDGPLAPGPLAALLLAALVSIPGLLHLDGLADSADGLLGSHERERRLEIMRDSRVGAFGVAAVALYLLCGFAAIGALHGPARTPALLIAPIAARSALVGVTAAFPYARQTGLGLGFRAAALGWPGRLAIVSGLLLSFAIAGLGGLIVLGAATAAAFSVALFAYRRLGGVTGDVLGAGCELGQLAALVVAGAFPGHNWLHLWP